MSYRKLDWVPEEILQESRPALVKAFHLKAANGKAPVDITGNEQGIYPEWLQTERVFATRTGANGKPEYRVKWCMLGYAESTWESAEDLQLPEVSVLLKLFLALWR
jgi:hypothetical protein